MTKRIPSLALLLCLLLSLLWGCGGVGGSVQSSTDAAWTPSPNSFFEVHFIDVGQADAALVICDGRTMLIDGGNRDDSDLIYSYLRKQGVTYLDYVVSTHPHEDHVGGLAGALTAADAGVVLSPVTSFPTAAFQNFVNRVRARGLSLTVPKAGDSFLLGSALVTVLGPVQAYDDVNNSSIVLRIVYGETSFLFTGDMEQEAERDLFESGVELRSTVLKVGHHGSNSSSTYRFLRAAAPAYGVISVGKDNEYGHPTESVLSRLRDAEVTLYRTDLHGDVVCYSDGKTVSFITQKDHPPIPGRSGTKE
ncbi:MAG: MBL fold metallo-hydrolase [Clostridia bacterium]|nr:MBL fold metallo-hydrolase [Clostridia bacterium]